MKIAILLNFFLGLALSGLSQARIEAESFTAGSNGVSSSYSEEEESHQVGWLGDSTWMEYAVSVPSSGFYKFDFRVANGFSDDATLQLRSASGQIVGQMPVPRTGGMNSWQTASMVAELPSGNQTLRVFVYKGVFSLNWFEIHQPLKTVPGKIEAEDFALASGVATETTQDTNGGLNVKDIDDGDYLDFLVNVSESSDYTFRFRVGNAYGYGVIKVVTQHGDTLATAHVPQTGGWQSWGHTEATVALVQGQQLLRFFFQRGAFNLNWIETELLLQQPVIVFEPIASRSLSDGPFELNAVSNHTESPLTFTSSDPGVLSVALENGQWLATPHQVGSATITVSQAASLHYHSGSAYQTVSIITPPTYQPLPGRIEAESFLSSSGLSAGSTSDDNGHHDIGWINDDQWLEYAVSVAEAGYYALRFRIANGFSDDASLQVRTADHTLLANVPIPRTGGMNEWRTTTVLASLPAGNQIVRIAVVKGVFSLNWFEAVRNVKPIPGRIEAESFDLASDVGMESNADIDAGINVHSIDDDDWLDYNVSVAQSGSHVFNFRIANAYGYGIIEIRNQSGAILGEVSLPQTGGWQNWSTVSTTADLPAGNQVLRLHAKRGAFNLNWFEVSEGSFAQAASVIEFPVPDARYVGDPDFQLVTSSNNTESPVLLNSSDSAIVTLTLNQGSWFATPVAAGTVTITATQAGSTHFLEATPVARTLTILPNAGANAQKINLDPDRWYILNNAEHGLHDLFDGQTEENVNIGWGMVLDEYDAYYPLYDNETIRIERIRMFDWEGIFTDKPMTVSVITSDWQRITLATFTGEAYGAWVGPYPDRAIAGDARFNLDSVVSDVRYIVLNIRSGLPTELEFYGEHTPGTPPVATVNNAPIKLKDMLGINAYEWNFQDGNTPWQINEDKMDMVKSFSGIRHYIDWEKLESSEGVYSYNPTLSGGWHYDQIYERCQQAGIDVLACIKTIPEWMLASYPPELREHESIPVLYGADITQPHAYIQQARMAFQFAARYGANTQVNPALLSVYDIPRWPGDNPNTIRIGTGLVSYMECDNERDKWWKGRVAYQTAREYAANMSAFYDGHKNTMGPGVGVKNADPQMKVVVAGLVSGPEYVRGMVDWCREFRGYKSNGEVDLCWDVINYHIYTDNTSSSQSGTSDRGAAVEVTNAHERTQNFVKVANELCYGMPVWITETGFDIHQDSPLKAIPIGSKTALDTQADWILRMSLFSARHKIGKVFYYQMFDDNDSGGIFSTSGLIQASDLTRRPAADFLYQTGKLFGEYAFSETLSQYPLVDRYQDAGRNLYILTMPTENGSTDSYSLGISGYPKVRIYTPVAGQNDMSMIEADVHGGAVPITVSETPVFVVPFNPEDEQVTIQADPAAARLAHAEPNTTDNAQLENLIVYPNIATDYLEIDPKNQLSGDLQIRIFDPVMGRIIKQETLRSGAYRTDVSQMQQGSYFLEIKQQGSVVYKRVLKVNR